MCEDPIRSMVSSETHQSQDLLVPSEPSQELPVLGSISQNAVSPSGAPGAWEGPNFNPDKMSQGPVNAITVLTLLDKLVNMLDTVQENQHKMEEHQVEMEGVVRGIQADMTKLSKSHSHTSNTVSKLLDKSRKVSVTMKEVRDRMERQGMQVKKLEANHAHLLNRNQFKVLIFQEENEIPSSVFVKDPPPFPRHEEVEEGGEPGVVEGNRSQDGGLHTIDLSSDEDVGLEAELEEEEVLFQDLENMEKSRAEKIKRSSLKKVDSLKKAFSRQNIDKKMTKIGNKIVSQEQREKIKQKTAFKVSPLTFSIRKPKVVSESQPAEASVQPGDSPATEDHIQLSPLGSPDQELPFTEVHAQLAPAEQPQTEEAAKEEKEEERGEKEAEREEEKEEEREVEKEEEKEEKKEEEEEEEKREEEAQGGEVNLSTVSEGVSEEYALSATLPQEEKRGETGGEKEEEEKEEEEKVAY